MPLATIALTSGRDIQLTYLEVDSTYHGLLEGYPNEQMNDRRLAALAKWGHNQYRQTPVHVIAPPRRRLEHQPSNLPFGAAEMLPVIGCRGRFESHPIEDGHEHLGYRSYLDVVWFRDDLSADIASFVTAAVADLDWDALARDEEL